MVTLLVSTTPTFAQELSIGSAVDKTEVTTGQPLTFSITIAGPIKETPKVQLTSFDGFQILSTGQSHQIQIQSGQIRQTLVLTYALAPTTPGTHTLGPVKVEYKGHTYQTQPIEVKVVPRSQEQEPSPEPRLEGGVTL